MADYRQERPFKIYVAGPNASTNSLFFGGVRTSIYAAGNKSGDRLEDEDADFPVNNAITVFRQRRANLEPPLRFRLVDDNFPVAGTAPPRPEMVSDNIDAYVLTFRIGSREDFDALYRQTIEHTLRLCQHQLGTGPPKVVFLVAHRANLYSNEMGFHPDDMAALMRRSNAVYREANLNHALSCAEVMDLVVGEVFRQHLLHQRKQAALARGGPPQLALTQPSSGWLELLRMLLPSCAAPMISGYPEQQHSYDEKQASGAPAAVVISRK